jgi:hypothetical protein
MATGVPIAFFPNTSRSELSLYSHFSDILLRDLHLGAKNAADRQIQLVHTLKRNSTTSYT